MVQNGTAVIVQVAHAAIELSGLGQYEKVTAQRGCRFRPFQGHLYLNDRLAEQEADAPYCRESWKYRAAPTFS